MDALVRAVNPSGQILNDYMLKRNLPDEHQIVRVQKGSIRRRDEAFNKVWRSKKEPKQLRGECATPCRTNGIARGAVDEVFGRFIC